MGSAEVVPSVSPAHHDALTPGGQEFRPVGPRAPLACAVVSDAAAAQRLVPDWAALPERSVRNELTASPECKPSPLRASSRIQNGLRPLGSSEFQLNAPPNVLMPRPTIVSCGAETGWFGYS